MNDSAVVQPTGLYLESGATTDNVGIGIAAPAVKLTIKETGTGTTPFSSGATALSLIQGSGNNAGYNVPLVFSDDTPNDVAGIAGVMTGTDNEGELAFGTRKTGESLTEKVRIDVDGNVGIGTSAVKVWGASITALQVGGSASLAATTTQGASGTLHISNNAYYDITDGRWEFISTNANDEASNYYQTSGSHLFRVTSTAGAAGAEITDWNTAMIIDSAGDVTFTGDLIMADGKGIDFTSYTDGSVAGSTTSQTLKDYEEGTWSPVLTDGSNDASMHGNTAGTYTKVGRMVTIWAYVQTSNLGSASGAISIKGLPFTQATTDAHGAGTWGYGNAMAISAGTNITGMVGSSTAIMSIRHWDVAGGTSALQASEWSSDADCSFTCSYIT
jgi:hypothetical protein